MWFSYKSSTKKWYFIYNSNVEFFCWGHWKCFFHLNALIVKGLVKNFKETKDNTNTSKFWSKNKNMVNNGVVDSKVINKAQNMVILQGPLKFNVQTSNTIEINSQRGPPRTNMNTRWKHTHLDEPIKLALEKLVQSNVITFPKNVQYEPQVKFVWWKDTNLCEYHIVKGHHTFGCFC